MNENMTHWKVTLAAFFSALGTVLGWKGIMALVWVAVMALDYLTGSAAALKSGRWSSAVAREGLWHKGGTIAVVAVAASADGVMGVICANIPGFTWPELILPLVLAWYILTETGSILENAAAMGAHIPPWLMKLLKAGLQAVNDAGEDAAGEKSE